MHNRIEELKEKLESHCLENGSVNYIVFRLREIRKELVKEDKIFETQNISKVIGISVISFVKLEKGTIASAYTSVIKLIHIYSLYGYNPLWILNKDNFFTDKKNTDSNFILNQYSVEDAVQKLTTQMKRSLEIQEDAIEDFKKNLKGN